MEENIIPSEKEEKIKDDIQLTKVNVVGRKWFHCFKMGDGTIQEIETTESDYVQLGQKNPVNPIIENGIWEKSYERYKFDTVDGDLSDDQYCDNGSGYLLKTKGTFIQAGIEEVVDHKIKNIIVDEAIKEVERLTQPIL